ncbi:FAD/FMN-containing dehydrogenase [Leifsonia xyli subsp. cynodontis DSM 46306]|jgi:FAD/FMN-containing dehydrogenase|uniref:FAD-binding PCMH-type domain-containing protein n=1 Tax=Leifsonia xyli subsp. cynodontis DSM 46306 TaxID=1389489 RepID=U3P8G0_LEIXC|nr:FAD-binding oxidoreductase [Leifsonia xyli]AGW42101.1 FAD/FMN-containing dehydrogenase [Leifsonia xyli subsp. cynodontis DSM 46306]
MPASRSSLTREQIAARLTELLDADRVETAETALREASVDRFKKYTAVHGIFDGPFPAAIAFPVSTEEVAAVLRFADGNRIAVVPRTGRTATEGGLETVVADSIVLDGSRMDAVLEIDEQDMMATVQCGVPLQRLEDTLRERGLTTGHSPQSKPLAQYGGLTATRSIGQFSTL